MSWPEPAAVMGHGPEARLVEAIEHVDESGIRCSSRGGGPWPWPRMLEGAAQAAGLFLGITAPGAPRAPVIAEYRDVAVHTASHPGPLRFSATFERRLLHFWRCRVAVHDAAGTLLLDGRVTLAPSRRGVSMPDVDTPPSDAFYAVLAAAGLGADLFNPRQHRSCMLVDHYALDLAVGLVRTLGLEPALHEPRPVDELLAARGFVPAFRRPLDWLLRFLATAGHVEADARGYRLAGALPPPRGPALRAAVLESDAAYAPALALLDEARAIYPRVASGETSGERALFLRARLWADYFSNANGYYGINNHVAAHAAAARLRPGGRVLEVGAGLGSATATLLAELRTRGTLAALGAYDVTEPVPFFRRRAEQTLPAAHPGVPLRFAALDLNQGWAAQGVPPAGYDLIFGVNVFHLARDLDGVLAEARAALAPGGFLVVGEGLRPDAALPVAAELPFMLLDSFADVQTDPATRPTAGFLTADVWTAALRRAGFENVELAPDAGRLQAMLPIFLAAAVCGRRG